MAFQTISETSVRVEKRSNLNAVFLAFAKEAQELRLGFADLQELNNIDYCEGKLLDRIGELVGLTRKQAGEMIGSRELADRGDVYRITLRYKAFANSCGWTPEEIMEATKIIFTATQVRYSENPKMPASFHLEVSAPFTDVVMSILGTHDLILHPAGVKVRTTCSTEDTNTFGFVDVNPNVAGFGEGTFAQSVS